MSCCSNAAWKHLVSTGAITRETIRAAAARRQAPAPSTADLIFVNGTFLLAEPTVAGEQVTAVAVAGETIVDVGDADRITREARPAAVTIDLGGDTLAPGFVEAPNLGCRRARAERRRGPSAPAGI
ncbi:hypothetical protein [Sorangium sp. So ce1078]|uniref:hypothetical protein n=1 Tax=Sorangium sp. So ce1078 TaxID=3133329 RepID=UPI003F623440